MNKKNRFLTGVLPAVVLGGVAFAANQREREASPVAVESRKIAGAEAHADREVATDVRGFSMSPVVKKVAPSVVKIFTASKPRLMSSQSQGIPPMMRRFFGEDFEMMVPGRNERAPAQRGVGSGVVVRPDGYVLTNNHVVDGADEVKVTLNDGREFTAKVIGKDPKSDVAVVKIDARDLPAIELGDSEKIEVGDFVLAVGNPYGIGQTVTSGIVSATGRVALGLPYEDFVQTDAAINPGNSGGALVDAKGRLIGINTAIFGGPVGGNRGIGFAIPVNLAREVMEDLIRDGKVTRGYLGVMIQDLSPALAREFRRENGKGALIGDVVAKGPAAKAGLENGDVVIEYDGKPVESSRALKFSVARSKPGASVDIKVIREGKEKMIRAKVGELPTEDIAKGPGMSDAESDEALQGVAVADLDPQTRRKHRIPETVEGVLITEVASGTAADEAGLKPGDVLMEVNRTPVRSAEEAVRMTQNPKDRTTLVKVWSRGATRYAVVDETLAPRSGG